LTSLTSCLGAGTSLSIAGPVSPWTRALDRVRWVHRTQTMQGLSFRFAVRSTDADLGNRVAALLDPLRSPVPAAHWYSLVSGVGGVDVFLDDEIVARVGDEAAAIAWLSWDLNRAVAQATNEHVLFHAGGAEGAAGGVLVPGPSGSGKSTLVAALVRSGLGYLSDEVVALRLSDAKLLPYPKALSIGARSLGALGFARPRQDRRGEGPSVEAHKSHVRASDLRAGATGSACEARCVVMPRYVPGASTYLRRLSPSEALLGLVTNTVNLERHGATGLRAVAELVEHCDSYELVMDDLDPACRLVLALLDQ
jgi:hypothetical protein